MYLLTIRDGLVTRHVGPYESPKQASDDLDRLLRHFGDFGGDVGLGWGLMATASAVGPVTLMAGHAGYPSSEGASSVVVLVKVRSTVREKQGQQTE